MSGRHTPGDNEATSEFSYTDSDVLNRPKDDETDSFYSSQYSTIPPPRKVKTPGDLTEGRDSYLSSMSEYSAHDLSQVARSVSVKVVNRPIEPTVNRSASIKKLETQQETTGRLSPDMSYDTTIEGSIPPRSTRRPKSQVVDESSLQAEIANYKTNFPARVQSMQTPASARVATSTASGSGRGHKTSLSISDELDKLMERANSIKSKSYTFENLEPGDDSSVESKYSKLEPPLAGYSKSANKRSSSESFKTASLNSGSEHSGPSETALRLPKRTEVPPRPSTENLARARQVSSKVEQAAVEKRLSQMSGSSRERIHQTLPQPPVTSDDESHYSDDMLTGTGSPGITRSSVGSLGSRGLGITIPGRSMSSLAPAEVVVPDKDSAESLTVGDKPVNEPSVPATSESTAVVPADYSPKGFDQPPPPPPKDLSSKSKSEHSKSDFDKSEHSKPENPEYSKSDYSQLYDGSPDLVKPRQVFDDEQNSSNYEDSEREPSVPAAAAVAAGAVGVAASVGTTTVVRSMYPTQEYTENDDEVVRPNLTPRTDAVPADPGAIDDPATTGQFKTPEGPLLHDTTIAVPPAPAPHHPNQSHDKALDDQFYDVDEPVVVEKPARGKSVKESTKHPRKPTRNTSKGRKSRGKRTSSSHEASGLKPFSYHTLINLLESINGTIIGEEFNQLNLPVKEKQLIEKIVDQLSRLTSDMVLDEHRYAVGIDRLERALRVLEGFM